MYNSHPELYILRFWAEKRGFLPLEIVQFRGGICTIWHLNHTERAIKVFNGRHERLVFSGSLPISKLIGSVWENS